MPDEANVRWLTSRSLEGEVQIGATFGMPWHQGLCLPGQAFLIEIDGRQRPLDSRELAYWADGSIKWTAHSLSGPLRGGRYEVKPIASKHTAVEGVTIETTSPNIVVSNQAGLKIKFSGPGDSSLFQSLSFDGRPNCSGADIVASINGQQYSTFVSKTELENATFERAVIKVSGISQSITHDRRLPFDVRVYMYANTPTVKVVHSFVHDLGPEQPLTSLGLRFKVPLAGTELYNRHIRLGGAGGGILKEEVQGLSGLRHGPTMQNKIDQTSGKPVVLKASEWEKTELEKGLSYICSWDSFSLSQLSSDGFTIRKRTKPGCSWIKINGGSRADGTTYIGSATDGGLAVGMENFWERYPTQIDLKKLTMNEGVITIWLYSPMAEPLDTRPYHDGLGLDTYAKQLEALAVSYEDYEPGFASANGIGRTNEFLLRPYAKTPSNQELYSFSMLVRDPPRLAATPAWLYKADVFHKSWSPTSTCLNRSPHAVERDIDGKLDKLFNFYRQQVEQNRWYGFWDHGDVQHTYDPYRHAWRYDVGGFAWDNSELSTDLWLWLYFLRTGRSDVFRMAEAMTRHTGEVDVYHTGRFKGFGSRHGVQHFSDSSKQLRISNVLYRRIYYYLTGDERTGDLISELEQCQTALPGLDSHRKVQQHVDVPAGYAMTNIGLDCGALAAAWLTAWERRTPGWQRCKQLIDKVLSGIGHLKHGIANNAVLLNIKTGDIRECPPPTPEYAISHLSMLFGFPEIITELLDYAKEELTPSVEVFKRAWLSYCRAYNGTRQTQVDEFGFEFPSHATWRQSHSTLTALVAMEENNEELAATAWRQFFETDGYNHCHDWTILKVSPPEYFSEGQEASWVTTNQTARFGVSAIVVLANVGKYL